MPESFYNKYEALNSQGNQLADEIDEALKPIFERWMARGHSIREIGHIIMDVACVMAGENQLITALKTKKEERGR